MISRELISKVLKAVNIVDVISQDTHLRHVGRDEYSTNCPFHSDSNPSFFVSESKQVFHCFSCGRKGNVISYVQDSDNITFVQAIKKLANEYEISLDGEVTQDELVIDERKKNYFDLMKTINNYFVKAIEQKPEALQYLKEQRKLNDEDIQRWSIGYDDGKLYQYLAKRGYMISELRDMGLVNIQESTQEVFDFFNNRITFPIFDDFGNIVAFSARALGNDVPKYKNSKSSQFYTKGNSLYNYDKVKETINQKDNLIYLFEGQNDVISAVKANVDNSISALGTAISENQISRILNLSDNIVLVYDSDEPGFNALDRTATMIRSIEKDARINVVTIPDNLDPDDYRRKYGNDKLNEVLEDYLPLIDYYIEREKRTFMSSRKTSVDKAKFVSNVRDIIATYANALESVFYNRQVNKLFKLNTDEEAKNIVGKSRLEDNQKKIQESETEENNDFLVEKNFSEVDRIQIHLLSAMLKQPELLELHDVFRFPDKSFQKIIDDNINNINEHSNYEQYLIEKALSINEKMSFESFKSSLNDIISTYDKEKEKENVKTKLEEAIQSDDTKMIIKLTSVLQSFR